MIISNLKKIFDLLVYNKKYFSVLRFNAINQCAAKTVYILFQAYYIPNDISLQLIKVWGGCPVYTNYSIYFS